MTTTKLMAIVAEIGRRVYHATIIARKHLLREETEPTMAAQREPIEVTPETTIREVIERIAGLSGEAELRLGADRLHVVYRREEEPAAKEPKGNVHLVLAAAKEFRDAVGEDFDFDAMRARIEEIREYDRQRPLPKLD